MAGRANRKPSAKKGEVKPYLSAETIEKMRPAWELRKQGLTYAEIGTRLGVDQKTAWNYVQAIYKHNMITPEQAAELRELEAARLDAMLQGIWEDAIGGDTKAIQSALSIAARRAKLYGLDEPEKIAAAVSNTDKPMSKEERDAALAKVAAIQRARGDER